MCAFVPGSCGLLQHMSVEVHAIHDDLVSEGVGEGLVATLLIHPLCTRKNKVIYTC